MFTQPQPHFLSRSRSASSSHGASLSLQLRQMRHDYFSNDYRVALSSQPLWEECQRVCGEGGTESSSSSKRIKPSQVRQQLSPLWKAHDDVMARLDDLQQPFLLQSNRLQQQQGSKTVAQALPDVIQQCLL